MGMLDGIKKWLRQADDLDAMAKDTSKKARDIAKMIPGDADDKFIDSVADKVDDATKQYDSLKKNIPGNNGK